MAQLNITVTRMRFHLAALLSVFVLASCGPAESCTETPVAQLCVRGTSGSMGEELTEDAPVTFQLTPEGCHSSGCTVQEIASCDVTVTGTTIALDGRFCLGQDGECSLPDCSGGGFVNCDPGMNLAAGDYIVTHGALSLPFTVPSTLAFGEGCVGDPF